MDRTEEFLRHVSLFRDAPAKDLERLAASLKSRRVAPGEQLVDAGEMGDAMFVVVSGQLEVYVQDSDTGVDVTLSRVMPCGYLGEMGVFLGGHRTASVRAVEDSLILEVTADDFIPILIETPQAMMAVVRDLCRRIEKLNENVGISFVDLSHYAYVPEAVGLIPQQVLDHHEAVPVRLTTTTLTVAMVEPNDLVALDDLRRFAQGRVIEPLAVTRHDYLTFLRRHGLDEERLGELTKTAGDQEELAIEYRSTSFLDELFGADREFELSGDVIQMFLDHAIGFAVDAGASDIHFEPIEDGMRLRFRIDGRLETPHPPLPKDARLMITSRIKILARMDIAEHRRPQDGKFTIKRGEQEMQLRVSTLPTHHGEKVVMRLLDKKIGLSSLDGVVLSPNVCRLVRRLVDNPHGMLIVSGPTGSGKSTTLYSILREIDRVHLNISTIEDPIEYEIDQVTQTQVSPTAGITFASTLRSLMRQDPDVILVGEIRDPETAHAAADAALTGHLVLTTLHTNDALSCIDRMRELGVDPSLLGHTLLATISQRLVRRICSGCRAPDKLSPRLEAWAQRELGHQATLEKYFAGRGCEHCSGAGYKGRVAAIEVVPMYTPLRDLIVAGQTSPGELFATAKAGGMVPMTAYLAFLVNHGITTAVEARRVLR